MNQYNPQAILDGLLQGQTIMTIEVRKRSIETVDTGDVERLTTVVTLELEETNK